MLITGAGGSIGAEMCRQVREFGPAKIILLEQAETPLFDIENELRRDPRGAQVVACICDICDRQRVQALWQQHRPEVVIHAAAHKHVPLMECNPTEAIKNNILGTRNVADACCLFDVAEFVLISTDKAVNPSSIIGASKRVAETVRPGPQRAGRMQDAVQGRPLRERAGLRPDRSFRPSASRSPWAGPSP